MTITVQKIIDGSKITVLKATIAIAADETKAILFNASDFITNSPDNKIVEIEYQLNGFSAELFWDAATDIPIMSLAATVPFKHDFWDIGGLINNAASTGKTGDILISTTGAAAGSNGHITLYLMQRKVPIKN